MGSEDEDGDGIVVFKPREVVDVDDSEEWGGQCRTISGKVRWFDGEERRSWF